VKFISSEYQTQVVTTNTSRYNTLRGKIVISSYLAFTIFLLSNLSMSL